MSSYPPMTGPYAAYSDALFYIGQTPYLHCYNGLYQGGVLIPNPTAMEYSSAFGVLDTDQDGLLSPTEFAVYVTEAWNGVGQQITSAEAQNLFAAADADGDGYLNYDEFVTLCTTTLDIPA